MLAFRVQELFENRSVRPGLPIPGGGGGGGGGWVSVCVRACVCVCMRACVCVWACAREEMRV